ncbi:MAG: hypothetical protein QNJ31_07630 [Candidatus Caenarcaniphilales bacterium]|nr:hypothetical protein [Candidatus Caenarcaniphilales bacterium]
MTTINPIQRPIILNSQSTNGSGGNSSYVGSLEELFSSGTYYRTSTTNNGKSSYNPYYVVVEDDPEGSLDWLGKLATGTLSLLGTLMVAGWALSLTGSKNANRETFHASPELLRDGEKIVAMNARQLAENGTEKHLLFPGTGMTKVGASKIAYKLSENIKSPVHLINLGSDKELDKKEEFGLLTGFTDYIRSGLQILDHNLGGYSPFGPGHAVAVDYAKQVIEKNIAESGGKDIIIHAYSIGGYVVRAALEKIDPQTRSKIKLIKFYGVPMNHQDMTSIEGLKDKVVFKMEKNDPFEPFTRMRSAFELPFVGIQSFLNLFDNGHSNHTFVPNYIK